MFAGGGIPFLVAAAVLLGGGGAAGGFRAPAALAGGLRLLILFGAAAPRGFAGVGFKLLLLGGVRDDLDVAVRDGQLEKPIFAICCSISLYVL